MLGLWDRKLLNKIFRFNMEKVRGDLKIKCKTRSYKICTHRTVLFGHQTSENETEGAHGTY